MGQLGKKAYQLIASSNHAVQLEIVLKISVQCYSEVANTVLILYCFVIHFIVENKRFTQSTESNCDAFFDN